MNLNTDKETLLFQILDNIQKDLRETRAEVNGIKTNCANQYKNCQGDFGQMFEKINGVSTNSAKEDSEIKLSVTKLAAIVSFIVGIAVYLGQFLFERLAGGK